MIDLAFIVQADVGEAIAERYRAFLQEDERERMGRFLFERHRLEYLCTRALVRTVLTEHAPAVAPAEWRFVANEYGRPSVAEGLPPITFNLSNSEGVIVCAVASEGEIGVDVEPRSRGKTILDIADTVFSKREQADLAALSSGERERHAVALWTAKEAYIKARAIGMSLPLEKFSVSRDGRLSFDGIDDSPDRWTLSYHEPLPTHLVCVCAERPGKITLRRVVP